jgi:hypothetical protein
VGEFGVFCGDVALLVTAIGLSCGFIHRDVAVVASRTVTYVDRFRYVKLLIND